jgi:sugar-specific transcriptional regulator TrmB
MRTSGCTLSGINLEGVEVLAGLGLSSRQARVYLALQKAGDAKAKTIAEYAQVERQEVYYLIEDLKLKGLVEQNLKSPTSYTATPIDQAIVLLLEQKSNELVGLTKKATRLATKLNQKTDVKKSPQPCFGTISDGFRGKKYLEAIQETKQSIDMITSWGRFKQQSFRFENLFRAKLKNDITLRFIVEKPLNNKLPGWVESTADKYDNFKVQTQSDPTATAISIFDQDKAAIAFASNASLCEGPDLWTTNPALTVLCQTYFDVAWKRTKSN